MRIKNLWKRVCAMVLAVSLLAGLPTVAAAAGNGSFRDVPAGHWAASYINDVVGKGLFRGTGEDTFSPNGSMSRAMFAVVLARLAGADTSAASSPFEDVADGSWCSGAIAWGYANGIFQGVTAQRFDPDGTVTRQQAAAMLYRSLSVLGKELPERADAKTFADAASLAGWAVEPVAALQQGGVIGGYPDGTFRPDQNVTRAEAAKFFSLLTQYMQTPAQDDGGSTGGGTVTPPAPTPTPDPDPDPTPTPDPDPTPDPEPETGYTVTFAAENVTVQVGGETVTQVTLDKGQTTLEFTVKAAEHHVISGAVTDNGVLQRVNNAYVLGQLTGDATVTVTTSLEKHLVTFLPQNGGSSWTVEVTHGEALEEPAAPVRENADFLGWIDATGTPYDFAAPVLGDLVLRAKWNDRNIYGTAIYLDGTNGSDENDGLSPESAVKTFAAAKERLPELVVDGVIYITNPVIVTGEETWDLSDRDAKIVLAEGLKGVTNSNGAVMVDGGSLTLSNIVLDGNREKVEASEVYLIQIKNYGSLTMNDGTVLQNLRIAKFQGGAVYLSAGSFTMNGGEITGCENAYSNGAAVCVSATNTTNRSGFFMNGGKISGNTVKNCGIVNLSGQNVRVELNGGEISGNIITTYGSSYYKNGIVNGGSGSTKFEGATIVVGGVKIKGNVYTDEKYPDMVPVSLYLRGGADTCILAPTEDTVIATPIYVANSNSATGKLTYLTTGTGLSKLAGKLSVQLGALYDEAVILSGAEGYTLTDADLEKLEIVNNLNIDSFRTYVVERDEESNQVRLAMPADNDIVVYVSSSGRDTNTGLAKGKPVKTLAKAKEILARQVAAAKEAGTIQEDTKFVIDIVKALTITEDTEISFTSFNEIEAGFAGRVMLRRNTSLTSSPLLTFSGCDVTLKDVILEGNGAIITTTDNKSSLLIQNGAHVTVEAGTVVQNFSSNNTSALFALQANKVTTGRNAELTFNGGVIRNCTGSHGAVISIYGASANSPAFNNECICTINDVLIENCVSTGSGLIYVVSDDAPASLYLNGGTFRNNRAAHGSVAGLISDTKSNIYIGGAVDVDDGDIYIINSESTQNGPVLVGAEKAGRWIYVTGPLTQDLTISCSLPVMGAAVVMGYGYTLTEADLAHVKVAGSALKLDAANNRIVITKTMD